MQIPWPKFIRLRPNLLVLYLIPLCSQLTACMTTVPLLPPYCSQMSEQTKGPQTQVLQIKYLSEVIDENFITQIEKQKEETVFVGITLLNTRWFVVRKKGLSYAVEKALFPPMPFNPLELICDIELLLGACVNSSWHEDAQMNHLTFSCPTHTDLKGEMTLFNHQNSYKLTIKFNEK